MNEQNDNNLELANRIWRALYGVTREDPKLLYIAKIDNWNDKSIPPVAALDGEKIYNIWLEDLFGYKETQKIKELMQLGIYDQKQILERITDIEIEHALNLMFGEKYKHVTDFDFKGEKVGIWVRVS